MTRLMSKDRADVQGSADVKGSADVEGSSDDEAQPTTRLSMNEAQDDVEGSA